MRPASMIEAVERRGPAESGASVEGRPSTKRGSAAEPWTSAEEMVAIDEGPAVRDEAVVVEDHRPAAKVDAPMGKAPAEAGEKADPETYAESDPGAYGVEAGIPEPTRVGNQRRAVHDPRVVGRNIDDLRVCRLD